MLPLQLNFTVQWIVIEVSSNLKMKYEIWSNLNGLIPTRYYWEVANLDPMTWFKDMQRWWNTDSSLFRSVEINLMLLKYEQLIQLIYVASFVPIIKESWIDHTIMSDR